MNLLQKARQGTMAPEIEYAARTEGIEPAEALRACAAGTLVIVKNERRTIPPMAVGAGTRTKINANIGASPDLTDEAMEIEKLRTAEEAGADTIMDLSIGPGTQAMRRKLLSLTKLPLGTVPLYETAALLIEAKKSVLDLTLDDFLETIRCQAEEGVDFMTIHSGVTRESVRSLKTAERIIGITSRGGSILAEWMAYHKKENPLYEHYDKILDIMSAYNVVISLGDGLRPGALHDAGDRGQIHEMILLGELAERARDRGVQAIIEGPGHMPLDMIADNMRLEKALCGGAPYYVLGPLVTDVAPGYDHITGAIGGAIAAASGADFLCYVTPAEHLRLPGPEEVRAGVMASRIAAHAADIVKLGRRAREWDDKMSRARKKRDFDEMFKLALDERSARAMRGQLPSTEEDQCSMCGEFCAIKRSY